MVLRHLCKKGKDFWGERSLFQILQFSSKTCECLKLEGMVCPKECFLDPPPSIHIMMIWG